jgi:excisionase family DNA binding protein
MDEQLMTVAEFAARIKVRPRTAYDLLKSRAIDAVDVGTGARPSYRVTESALAKFVKSREIKGRPR